MKTLFIVATPIGNLADITLRALDTLKKVDLIACEDTRVTNRLLAKYQISKPTISYHQHSKISKVDRIIAELKNDKDVALVSDAGTPGVSDPGNKLVAAAIEAGIKVEPIPGPSALTALLSVAGFAVDNFIFLGFLPNKKGRQTLFKQITQEVRPVIFYESTHRIIKALEQLAELLDPERKIVIGRELTKIYEEVVRGSSQEVLNYFNNHNTKGEFVIAIQGK